MPPITDRPKDSTAEESYKVGEKVYYWKNGRIESLLNPHLDEIVDSLEDWRKGEVKSVDSEQSSNPLYEVRNSRSYYPYPYPYSIIAEVAG